MVVVKKCGAKAIMWLLGWRVEGEAPSQRKFIVVGHPHTSNWDFPLFVFTLWIWNMPMKWMGKQSLFQGPFGWLFRSLGGLPVDRSGGKNTVQAVADLFAEHEELMLGIAPSGTRKGGAHWRSGFYHMAMQANVPLVLGSIDFKMRAGRIIGTVHPSGNIEADMEIIRNMYAGVEGRYPDRQMPIRLASEAGDDHSPQNK